MRHFLILEEIDCSLAIVVDRPAAACRFESHHGGRANQYTGSYYRSKMSFIAVGDITNALNNGGSPGKCAVLSSRRLWSTTNVQNKF